jgi:hypothetical protein
MQQYQAEILIVLYQTMEQKILWHVLIQKNGARKIVSVLGS